MFDRAKKLYDLQKKAKVLQRELKETEIEARSQDGTVVVIFNGEQHLKSVQIDPSVLTPEKKALLERNLQNTIAEAISKAQAVAAEKSKKLMGDMGMDIPGL